MPLIHLETFIAAPIELCFDLNRDIDVHIRSTARTRERAVAGVTSGLIGAGQDVTWEAVHFGIKQRLTTEITLCERPHVFIDEQAKGPFQGFNHRHVFRDVPGGTLMIDDFDYSSPFGILGLLADKLFLERYMRKLLVERARVIACIAESTDQESWE